MLHGIRLQALFSVRTVQPVFRSEHGLSALGEDFVASLNGLKGGSSPTALPPVSGAPRRARLARSDLVQI